jgi:hypothetical protein
MGGEESGGGRKRVLVGSYRAGPLAGEDWQKRKRISFTLRDRLDRHAIAAGAFASLLVLDPSLSQLCLREGRFPSRLPARRSHHRRPSFPCSVAR